VHTRSLQPWQHDHAFGQHVLRAGERRTLFVMLLTSAMMVVEISAGIAFGSMALLADGLHMASHASALGLAVIAYVYARRHADDRRFTFGTGKVNAIAGYSSALVLAFFALLMAWQSGERLLRPRPIDFDEAILVALLGLAVNLASILMLRGSTDRQGHAHDHADDYGVHGDDHNLHGAYLHVLADALTSVLAIVSLGAGKVLGWSWLDPVVGLLGAVLVSRWAWGLARDSGGVLLDREAPVVLREQIRISIENDGDTRVADLHVWSVGSHGYAAVLSIVAHQPRAPEEYKALIPARARVVHATIEVHRCDTEDWLSPEGLLPVGTPAVSGSR
jgi:cation diffusion facilitator family transporter